MSLADPAAAMFGVPVTRVGYTTGLPTELADSFTITVAADSVDQASTLKFAIETAGPEVSTRPPLPPCALPRAE